MDYKNKQGRALKIDSDYTLMASVIFITYLISIRCKDSCRHSLITFKARRTSESEEDELYLYQIFSVSLPNCKPSESNRGSVPFAFMPLNCQLSTTSPPLLSSHLDVYHTISVKQHNTKLCFLGFYDDHQVQANIKRSSTSYQSACRPGHFYLIFEAAPEPHPKNLNQNPNRSSKILERVLN